MDEHAKKANQGKAPKGVSKKRKKPHKVQHSPWVGAGMGYAASRPTSHCNLCFDVLSADHTLEIAASALLSTTLGYCCGSPKFSCSAMQIFRTARQHWLLSRHCSAAWTSSGTGRRIRLYMYAYIHMEVRPRFNEAQ